MTGPSFSSFSIRLHICLTFKYDGALKSHSTKSLLIRKKHFFISSEEIKLELAIGRGLFGSLLAHTVTYWRRFDEGCW